MSKSLYDQIGTELAAEYEATSGQMFGKPCLKIQNKAFAAFFQDEMVFKLGAQEVNLMLQKYEGAQKLGSVWQETPNERLDPSSYCLSGRLERIS